MSFDQDEGTVEDEIYDGERSRGGLIVHAKNGVDRENGAMERVLDDCLSTLALFRDEKCSRAARTEYTNSMPSWSSEVGNEEVIDRDEIEDTGTNNAMREDDEDDEDVLIKAAKNRIKKQQHQYRFGQNNIYCYDSGKVKAQIDLRNEKIEKGQADSVAVDCLALFQRELESLEDRCTQLARENLKDEKILEQEMRDFSDFCEERFIKANLDLYVPAEFTKYRSVDGDETIPAELKTIMKVRKLITRFTDRCKDGTMDLNRLRNIFRKKSTAGLGDQKQTQKHKYRYWACQVCGKNDLLFEERKCSVCGRHKRYLQLSLDKVGAGTRKIVHDPIEVQEQFLGSGGDNSSATETKEDQIRRHYLYGKTEYDVGKRIQLAKEANELLYSVRNTTL